MTETERFIVTLFGVPLLLGSILIISYLINISMKSYDWIRQDIKSKVYIRVGKHRNEQANK